jgi:gelsolin
VYDSVQLESNNNFNNNYILFFSLKYAVGSDIDHKVKAAAAAGEAAWEGIGQEPGVQIWRIEKFQVKPWPKEQHGEFFRGDSYIVLNTFKEGDALKHDIHIWIGGESSQDEYGTAAYKMVEADECLGGAPIQHRQVEGKESTKFVEYFEALEYLDGGIETGFNHVEATPDKPLLFRVKGAGSVKTLKMMQVPMAKSSLNEENSFILYAGKDKVWCWNGQGVSFRLEGGMS